MKSNDSYLVKVVEIGGQLGIKLPNKLTKLLNWNEGDKVVFETLGNKEFSLKGLDMGQTHI